MGEVRLAVFTKLITKVAGGAALLALAGCLGPTYGTGTPATQQLADDMTNILSFTPKQGEKINYQPRPELVKPSETAALPAPQDSVSQDNPLWPKSPEQQLAEVRQYADENRDKAGYVPIAEDDVARPVYTEEQRARDNAGGGASDNGGYFVKSSSRKRRALFRQNKEVAKGAYTGRRYLSDPPSTYREPEETAPYGELGEDERKKERARRAAARKKGGGIDLRRLVPWS